MKYRILGSTGARLSVVGIGTWQFGGEWGRSYTQSDADEIIDAARQEGINLIDTAECYGDHLSERLVGKAIARDRDKWIVATKFGHRYTNPFEREQLWTARDVEKQLDASLLALRTDYIDLYQFHSGPNDVFDNPELWQMLRRLKAAGKVRHLGISISPNTNVHQTDRAVEVGAEAIQVVYNRLDREPEEAVFSSCERQNLGVLARVPLASGFLSGKYQPGARFDATDVRSTRDAAKNDELLRKVARIRQDEVPEGTDMASWALAWCLRHNAVTSVIPGCKSPEQVRSNSRAVAMVDEMPADTAGTARHRETPGE
ncbi:MAG TPA: aldo/keto reductase [Spirochaetia bacterium]|nr:aldo/keto reductase [Spirochaetia bacterium]